MKKRRITKTHRMLFVVAKGQPMISLKLRYSDANRSVTLTLAGECMNSQMALRLAAKFPHPVFFAEFTKSRAWIVDKMVNGTPTHAVRYTLSARDSRDIDLFDEPGGKAKMIRAGLVVKTVQLLAPSKAIRRAHGLHHAPHKDTGSQKRSPINRGSYARARKAGLILPLSVN